jgi:hypothetical protein
MRIIRAYLQPADQPNQLLGAEILLCRNYARVNLILSPQSLNEYIDQAKTNEMLFMSTDLSCKKFQYF